MARTTWIYAVALGCLASGAGLADAASKPPVQQPLCQQVVDPSGDAQPLPTLNPAGLPQVPSLDITSADIASGSHKVAAVIRVASLAPDPATTLGSSYSLSWVIGDVTQSLTYRTFADAAPDAVFDTDTSSGTLLDLLPADFTVDPATNTIAIFVKRQADPLLRGSSARAPARFTTLTANTSAGVARANGQTYSNVDIAKSVKTYKDMTATCVKGT